MVKMALPFCKKIFALLRGITSKQEGDLYCLNCSYPYSTQDEFEIHKDVCENHNYCYIEMFKEDNHGEKSMKVPFIISANLESLLEKMGTDHNNPEKSSATKINKHTSSGYLLLTNR